jgi:hypothetical protein
MWIIESPSFAQLQYNPEGVRLPGHVAVENLPPIVADDEEAIEHTESDGWNREEVHRGDGFPMVSKEREPSFCHFGISRRPFHAARDGSLGNIKTEHEKLAMDARCTPSWILGDHPEDQIPNLLRNSSPSCWLSDPGDQTPVESKACPVPTDDGFGRNHDEGLFPLRPKPTSGDPEEFVDQRQPRLRVLTLQDSELLPKREILQRKLPTATEKPNEYSEPEQEQIVHEPGL